MFFYYLGLGAFLLVTFFFASLCNFARGTCLTHVLSRFLILRLDKSVCAVKICTRLPSIIQGNSSITKINRSKRITGSLNFFDLKVIDGFEEN